jgi:hypothetical protein
MKTWGEAFVKNVIAWLLTCVNSVRVGRPLADHPNEISESLLSVRIRVPVVEVDRNRLCRGPTFLTRRSDLYREKNSDQAVPKGFRCEAREKSVSGVVVIATLKRRDPGATTHLRFFHQPG